jgi:hypothetical protein
VVVVAVVVALAVVAVVQTCLQSTSGGYFENICPTNSTVPAGKSQLLNATFIAQ